MQTCMYAGLYMNVHEHTHTYTHKHTHICKLLYTHCYNTILISHTYMYIGLYITTLLFIRTHIPSFNRVTGDKMPTLLLKVHIPSRIYFQHGVLNHYDKYNFFTLGPTNATVSDFWQMIWDQKCLVIVMLTNIEENGRVCGGEGLLYTKYLPFLQGG